MYTITLADGTKLTKLELNGNNYVAPGLIEDSLFEGNLGTITISDGTSTETYEDMVLVQNTTYDGKTSWFILSEKPPQEKEKEALNAEITALQLALVEVYETLLGGM
ncbi:MAG: hypothetical protein LBR74_04725 [Eubacterium sp.]|jgi:hypothetical protein|nr:hypothetical protein [Eubacterium sp.]